MRKLFIILSFILSVFLSGCAQFSKTDTSRWMSSIADSIRICKLSIPATHDSGALLGGEFLQTQDLSIAAQLEKGVRGFDIRLQATEDSLLGVFHASQFQNINWEHDVLPVFINFLDRNPSETLIVSLKCEGGSKEAYRMLLCQSLFNTSWKNKFIWNFSPALTLQSCRGKILFIHRDEVGNDYPGALCLNWGDNTTCDVILRGSNLQEAIVSVEDEYQYSSISEAINKSNVTIQNIQLASQESHSSNKWFISFASATALPVDGPRAFAEEVNPTIVRFLDKDIKRLGIMAQFKYSVGNLSFLTKYFTYPIQEEWDISNTM